MSVILDADCDTWKCGAIAAEPRSGVLCMEGFIARPSISGLGNESKVKDPTQTKHTPLENMPSVKAQKRKLDEREPSHPDSQGLPSQHFSLQDMDTLPLPEPKPTHSPAERCPGGLTGQLT